MNQAYLFNKGENFQSYKMLGARPDKSHDGEPGFRFAVWAPNAGAVNVVGDFNHWNTNRDALLPYGTTGIWTGFIAGAEQWQRYKYAIKTADGRIILKADPFARHSETRPNTASILYDPDDYEWQDQEWLAKRADATAAGPLNIYECHLGSWRRYADNNVYTYREIAPQLASYLQEMGYNAVEFMPVNEYPLDGSWGYQVTGYFAITSRYGTPADFKYLVDTMHQAGIRVIIDWVPAHFPRDDFALASFDGQPLFEHPDPRRGEHPSWGTLIFNYGLNEVSSFLISSAWFLLDEFHADGLRIDAVNSIISLNFGHDEEQKITNELGGEENLEGIEFICKMNKTIREHLPHALLIAEDSTAWPNVTRTVDEGGLGFTHKWNMGWMNNTLAYMESDYYARGNIHKNINFSLVYAFCERFVLPFSHDEVVHGKKSLLGRMPGDYWRQFASLRSLYLYQYTHPGAKLNFMGNEFAPYMEWRFYEELEWFMLKYPAHRKMQQFVKKLNHLYLQHEALWQDDNSWSGFHWLQVDDSDNSVFAYLRRNLDQSEELLCLLNFTPRSFASYKLAMPSKSSWRLLLDSDDEIYEGSSYLGSSSRYDLVETTAISGIEKRETLTQADETKAGWQLDLRLPPLAGLIYIREQKERDEPGQDG